MENYKDQLSFLGVSYNLESFKKAFDVDLIGTKRTVLQDRYKYFNSERRLRVYIPKLLYWILKKDSSFNFYITRTSVVETENKLTLYLSIEIDFYFENYREFTFTISEIKSYVNAKYLPFNPLTDENLKGDYLFSKFGFLKVIAERSLLAKIEKNVEMFFYINFYESKNSIILKS